MKRNFFHRYLSAKVLPIWTILLIDVFIIVISSLLAYALRYDFRSIFLESSTIDKTILWTVVVNLIFFRVFRTYSNVLWGIERSVFSVIGENSRNALKIKWFSCA